MRDLPPEWIDSHLFVPCLGCRCWKMSTSRRNKELTTAAWQRQTAKRVMVWWQMDTFFFKIPIQRHIQTRTEIKANMWAVYWVAPCPWVRAIFAQALLSLFAGLSLNPSGQDWLNRAAVQLGCFLSNKQNHVVWRYLRAERGWKTLKQTGLNQREIRKHMEVHTEIAPRTSAP